jgi:hypothetical protein
MEDDIVATMGEDGKLKYHAVTGRVVNKIGKFSPFNGWTYPPSEAVRPSSSGEHYRGYLLYR